MGSIIGSEAEGEDGRGAIFFFFFFHAAFAIGKGDSTACVHVKVITALAQRNAPSRGDSFAFSLLLFYLSLHFSALLVPCSFVLLLFLLLLLCLSLMIFFCNPTPSPSSQTRGLSATTLAMKRRRRRAERDQQRPASALPRTSPSRSRMEEEEEEGLQVSMSLGRRAPQIRSHQRPHSAALKYKKSVEKWWQLAHESFAQDKEQMLNLRRQCVRGK